MCKKKEDILESREADGKCKKMGMWYLGRHEYIVLDDVRRRGRWIGELSKPPIWEVTHARIRVLKET
jgi:hypothetical protein